MNVYEDEKIFMQQNTYVYIGYILYVIVGFFIINTISYLFV